MVKAINSKENKHFLQFAKDYINYTKQQVREKRPSYLCLVYGAFKVREQSYIIMENLRNFSESDDSDLKTYDLKGSEINRFQAKLKEGSTLQDTNFLVERNGEPIYLKGGSHQATRASSRRWKWTATSCRRTSSWTTVWW